MRPTLGIGRLALSALSLAVLTCAPSVQARPHSMAGSYECMQVRANGKLATCHSAPLLLKKDGSFELRGWEGNYVVAGDYVELSDSKVRSRAKIVPGHKIVFRYHGKEGSVEVIYERRVAVLGKIALS